MLRAIGGILLVVALAVLGVGCGGSGQNAPTAIDTAPMKSGPGGDPAKAPKLRPPPPLPPK